MASATAPSSLFEGQPTARGRPLTKLDGVRLLSRPAVSPYHLEDVAGIAPTGLLAEKLVGSWLKAWFSPGLIAILLRDK